MGRIFNIGTPQQSMPLRVNPNPQTESQSAELTVLKDEVEKLKNQNQALVTQTQQALEQYRTKLGELISEKKIIAEQSEKEIEGLKNKVEELTKKSKNIAYRSEKAIEYFRQKVTVLLEQNKTLIQKNKEETSKLQETINKVTLDLENISKQKSDDQKSFETKIAELTAQNETSVVQIRMLQKQLDEARKQSEDIKNSEDQKLEELSFRNQELSKQYEMKLAEFVSKSQETLATYQSRIDTLTQENQQLIAQINSFQQRQTGQFQPIPTQTQFVNPQPIFQTPPGYQPSYQPPSPQPTPLWANIEQPPRMPIVGERRFEISEDLKKRLKPLQTQAEIPVEVLKSTFGVEQKPFTQPTPTVNPQVVQPAPKNEQPITSDVQVLISQLTELQNQAKESEIGKEEFENRLTAALKTVGNLTKEEQIITPPPQPISSPVSDKRVEELTEKNKQLLEQIQELKSHLENTKEQAQMSEKEKENFRQKLGESIKALSRVSLVKPENIEERIKIEQEEIEPETTKVKLVKRKITKGSMPPLTNTPNVINGVAKDSKGIILPDAIIVVKDAEDNSVRALKTNKLGQFAISTPLPNGIYTVELEKEGYKFDIIQIEVMGEVLPPLEIRSQ